MIAQEINILQLLGNAGIMVKFVLLLLIAFSVTSWGIIIMKFLEFRKANRESELFKDFFWSGKDLSEAFAQSKQLSASPVARIYRIGYLELKKVSQLGLPISSNSSDGIDAAVSIKLAGIDNIKRALSRATNAEIHRMQRMVPFLATTGNSTPFIGLFGTVWGIMNSFHGIGQRGSASLAVVAPGISEALIATAAGLAVAIPAVIAFNFFMQKVRSVEADLSNFSSDFLNIVERDMLRNIRPKSGNNIDDGIL